MAGTIWIEILLPNEILTDENFAQYGDIEDMELFMKLLSLIACEEAVISVHILLSDQHDYTPFITLLKKILDDNLKSF